jgi:hypothetical protein
MGRQTGAIKFIGKVGTVTGYIRDGQHLIKSAEESNPGNKRAQSQRKKRENNTEFGNASSAGRRIREAANLILSWTARGSYVNRLTSAMQGLVELDTGNPFKQRKVLGEHLHFIKGFEFNEKAEVSKIIVCDYEYNIDADSGIMTVFFKPFVPKESIAMPRGATHFRLAAQGCVVNTEKDNHEQSSALSATWSVGTTEAIAIELRVSLPLKVEGAKMLMLGVHFYEEKFGKMKLMKERSGVRVVEVKG